MANIPTRRVLVKFKAPYYTLDFVDSTANLTPNWEHDVVTGSIRLDSSNDSGVNAIGAYIQQLTRLWCDGADFQSFSRRFSDQ